MTARKIIRLSLTIFTLFSFGAVALADEAGSSIGKDQRYWISFTSFLEGNTNGTKYLMQIDSSGNVLKDPKKVVTSEQFASTSPATAISKNGTNQINLWMIADGGAITKAVIDKQLFTLKKLVSTGVGTINPNRIAVTQKARRNFLVVERESDRWPYIDLFARGVFRSGVLNGRSWLLKEYAFDGFDCGFFCSGGVSSDGKTAFWLFGGADYHPELTIRALNDSGRPDGFSLRIGNQRDLSDAVDERTDVSNVLSNGNIFVVYKYNESFKPEGPTDLYLRIIDSNQGQFLGDRILLTTVTGQIGDLVIDPLGRFVVFSQKPHGHRPSLRFQALDVTGHPSGESKILVRKAFPSGIDVLKDTAQ